MKAIVKATILGVMLGSSCAYGKADVITVDQVTWLCMGYANGYVESFKEHNDKAGIINATKFEQLQLDLCIKRMIQANKDGLIKIVPEVNL